MNKSIYTIACLSLVLVLTGCSNKENLPKPKNVEGPCIIKDEKAPQWVCGGYEETDQYIAVGSAPYSKLGHNFSRNEAIMNARSNLINQIKLDIKNKAESYMRSVGLEDNELVEKVVTKVSKQTASLSLNDSKQISYWQHPNDLSIHVLVSVAKTNINNNHNVQIKKNVDTQLQLRNSEDALNQMQ